MTKKEIYTELQAWEQVQKGLDAQLERLHDAEEDEDFLMALHAVAKAHTDAVAKIVGDKRGALNWWRTYCRFGGNPLSVWSDKEDRLRKIKTLKQLAALIAE